MAVPSICLGTRAGNSWTFRMTHPVRMDVRQGRARPREKRWDSPGC